MKFKCQQKIFFASLQNVNRAIQLNNTLPILNNVMIKAENGKVTLSGTNLEIAIQSSFEAKIENEGGFTVPVKILSSYIGLLKDADLSVQLEASGVLVLSQGISETKIKGIAVDEFPIIPKIEKDTEVDIKANDLKLLISQIVFAASNNQARPILTGVLFEKEGDEIKLAATDSYRLSERKLKLKNSDKENIKSVIPAKTLLELSKIISGEEKAKIYFAKNQVVFEWENVKLISKLIEGAFPDYSPIIPKGFNVKVDIDKADLLIALRKLSIFAVEKNGSINMSTTNDNTLHLFTEKTLSGESKEDLPANIDGQNTKVFINANYLIDVLNNIETAKVQIEMGEKLTPVAIKPLNKEGYINIIMPLR
ncbi:MAG: polymerase III subunit beta, DNA polymerase III subunit beta protein [Candidatus Peregrinibacteria bacterium GW2011_GWF2_33_10]|nr:MAG: polymerase III subunit beta, DNA polymerase III subunit beta protein [Candidatus Peregrinibacteria bacterium GW2011_GWF2_33_10]OGJ45755.1 MAG: DNA polymerase III subunit beta [Candidatus Peregrinibacteria bacterium RIFOXYA2_FULL_33_21]OGJ46815.1 MAG: DNA polymerase III subunit beta [Candidatus Peregrinibacteria bacterium RIFOXYA12_FULL_33_12]OGJ51285.1 MAG: DNA polymerase III subunit beta [Candidatus Peregrinibacteria bacterium RIFOXYB2_FULL_33_20]